MDNVSDKKVTFESCIVAINNIALVFNKMAESTAQMYEAVTRMVKKFFTASSKRVVYLSTHGKKERTRKKNKNRMVKEFIALQKRGKK